MLKIISADFKHFSFLLIYSIYQQQTGSAFIIFMQQEIYDTSPPVTADIALFLFFFKK